MVRNALSLIDNFNQLTPYAVGFDRVFDRLNNYIEHNATSTGFPPYNIQKVEDFKYEIELALAGFNKNKEFNAFWALQGALGPLGGQIGPPEGAHMLVKWPPGRSNFAVGGKNRKSVGPDGHFTNI